MTDKKKYPYWLAVEESKTVCFADLPHMMAKAMHPNDSDVMDYAAARINLENELPQAVRDDLLRVRNPAGLGLHTSPHGNALQRAVMLPDTDLEPFLNERGIELRLTPHGSGPEYWTLENAAAAMQEQLNWHDGTRAEFQDQLQAAAQAGGLVIREPRTCLPIDSPNARTYWELVTPADVNEWLEKLGAPYRWNAQNDTPRTPEYQAEYVKAWENLDKIDELKMEIRKWEVIPAVTVSELERKEQRIVELSARIDNLNESIFPAQPQAATAPEPVVLPASESQPLALTTGDIAFCFADLRWSEQEWKKPLGDKPKWLQACVHTPGQRGVFETRWNPVSIGAALVNNGHVLAKSVRARFQTKDLLEPWLDSWRTYEADNLTTE